MRITLGTTLAAALLTVTSVNAGAQHYDAGHSLEADQHDERAEGAQARAKASVRVRWQDSAGRHDPTITVKLLGINDFHGQLSPRSVGPRPAGGAAVLASYLATAADPATGPHSSFMRAITSVRRRRIRRCCRTSRRSACSTSWPTSGASRARLFRKLPLRSEAYTQPRCNVVGTFGNHEFDEGIGEALRLLNGGNHREWSVPREALAGRALPVRHRQRAEDVDRQAGAAALHHQGRRRHSIGFIGAVLKETPTIVTPTASPV